MISFSNTTSILTSMSRTEKRQLLRYFSKEHSNTKEFELLKTLHRQTEKKQINLLNRIKKLGYNGFDDRALFKLHNRLKHKIHHYLISEYADSHLEDIDSNSHLRNRILRNIQMAVNLMARGFYEQSTEKYFSILKELKDAEIFELEKICYKGLMNCQEAQDHRSEALKIQNQLLKCQLISDKFQDLQFRFYRISFQLENQTMDQLKEKITDLQRDMMASKLLFDSKRIDAMISFLNAAESIYENDFIGANSILINQLKQFRDWPSIFEVRLKSLFLSTFIKTLVHSGHTLTSYQLANKIRLSTNPGKAIQTHLIANVNFTLQQEHKCSIHDITLISDERTKSYLNLHYLFSRGEYQDCLKELGISSVKFNTKSTQKLDLMILEMMCLAELNSMDLLEYKWQSYLKNLAYRGKLDVPVYYHELYKIFGAIKNEENQFNHQSLHSLHESLILKEENGWNHLCSVQPLFSYHWIRQLDVMKNERLISGKKAEELSQLSQSA